MFGLDIVLLLVFGMKFMSLFTSKSSLYLYALDEASLAVTLIPLLLIIIYIILTMRRGKTVIYRTALLLLLGVLMIGSLLGIQLVVRQQTQPYLYIHDGGVQTEDAIDALRAGQNPYAISYVDRTFGAFPDLLSEATQPNPAWLHYVYLPLPLLLGMPLESLARETIGFFDIRLLYALAFIVFVAATAWLVRDSERRILVLILALFNPLFTPYVLSGFNDIFFLAFIALGAVLLGRQRWLLAAFFFGLAFASKQSAWFFLPVYLFHLFFISQGNWRLVWRRSWPAIVVPLLIMLPFIAWSPADFFDDIWRYPSGSAPDSYPISGFGFSQLLLQSGMISSMWNNYPFWIWQLVAGLPLLWWLVRWQRQQPTIERLFMAYGLLSFVLWFFSRFFNDNYIGVVSVIFLLAFAARPEPEKTS